MFVEEGKLHILLHHLILTSERLFFFLIEQELKYHQNNYPRYVVLYYFARILDSQKSCRDSTENFPFVHVLHNWGTFIKTEMLMFVHTID